MARSYKKHNFTGLTCKDSEKKDKRFANRRFRRANHQVKADEDTEAADFKLMRECSNVWDFSKDGKLYVSTKSIRASKFFKATKKGKLRK